MAQRWQARVASHLRHAQHRNAYYLMLNPITGAAAGVVFWVLFTRVAGLPPAQIGLGYAVVALGTIVGLLAKGGLDTAVIRSVPQASGTEGRRILRFGVLVGVALAFGFAFLMAAGSTVIDVLPHLGLVAWLLVAAIGILLVVTWLQDAYFVAEANARYSFQRNLVFSAARLVLPVPLVLLAASHSIALAWALALGVSAVVAAGYVHGLTQRMGGRVPRRLFLRSAVRNASSSTAEFLPGLVLPPIVLSLHGAEAAAFFGIAWTAASLLFLASAAVSRSALAEMVRNGTPSEAAAIRRGAIQHAAVVLPGAALMVVVAPLALSIFGAEYAREGATVLRILAASTVAVAPFYFYLGLLRARERPGPLVLYPAAMLAVLTLMVFLLERGWGTPGVAMAWFAANLPFAGYALWKLRLAAREVMPRGEAAPTVGGAAYPE